MTDMTPTHPTQAFVGDDLPLDPLHVIVSRAFLAGWNGCLHGADSNALFKQVFDEISADATCALRGAQKESGWQSIDSAPKDGTHILLYRKHIRFVGFYAPNGECWVHNAPGLPLINPEPTHWSPLREMPTPEGEAK